MTPFTRILLSSCALMVEKSPKNRRNSEIIFVFMVYLIFNPYICLKVKKYRAENQKVDRGNVDFFRRTGIKSLIMKKVVFYIGGVIIGTSLLTSCVSKKKFEELARAKRLSDREIAVLQGRTDSLLLEMATLRDGFNEIRYQLTLNNAAKDRMIDELSGKLRALESKESALKTELKDAHEAAKVNVMNKESELATLQEEVKAAVAERDKLREELTDYRTNAEWDNRKLKNEVETIKSNIKFKDEEIARLNKEIESVKAQVRAAKAEVSKKEAEIKKLTNQVNLLKSELKKGGK